MRIKEFRPQKEKKRLTGFFGNDIKISIHPKGNSVFTTKESYVPIPQQIDAHIETNNPTPQTNFTAADVSNTC
jgi:Tol biopolymer transport system component